MKDDKNQIIRSMKSYSTAPIKKAQTGTEVKVWKVGDQTPSGRLVTDKDVAMLNKQERLNRINAERKKVLATGTNKTKG